MISYYIIQAVTASAGTLILPDFAIYSIERSTICTPEQGHGNQHLIFNSQIEGIDWSHLVFETYIR